MFGISLLPNVRMQDLHREMTILSQLYALYSDADAMLARHRACPWLEVSVDTISNDIDRVVDLCHNQPPESQSTGCFRHLMSKLDDVRQLLPLVALLRHDTVRRRHWLGLQEVIGARLPVPFDRASEPNPFPLEALLSVCRSQIAVSCDLALLARHDRYLLCGIVLQSSQCVPVHRKKQRLRRSLSPCGMSGVSVRSQLAQ